MMKYSLNPFRWLQYLILRRKYRYSRWLHFYASVPYNKRYVKKLMYRIHADKNWTGL